MLTPLRFKTRGFTINLANLSYVYKLQFDNDLYFLPAVTLGFGSQSVNPENLIFEDQLNTATGFINTESIDPLAPVISNVNYLDSRCLVLIALRSLYGWLNPKALKQAKYVL